MTNPKKDKSKVKIKLQKSQDERIKIKKDLIQQLQNHSVFILDSVQPFIKILTEYTQPIIDTGYSGSIYLPEINRNLDYCLPMRPNTEPMVKLSIIK